jgi:hypothetical protein
MIFLVIHVLLSLFVALSVSSFEVVLNVSERVQPTSTLIVEILDEDNGFLASGELDVVTFNIVFENLTLVPGNNYSVQMPLSSEFVGGRYRNHSGIVVDIESGMIVEEIFEKGVEDTYSIMGVFAPQLVGEPCNETEPLPCNLELHNCANPCSPPITMVNCESGANLRVCCPLVAGQPCEECGRDDVGDVQCDSHSLFVQFEYAEGFVDMHGDLGGIVVRVTDLDQEGEEMPTILETDVTGRTAEIETILGRRYRVVVDADAMAFFGNGSYSIPFSPIDFEVVQNNGGNLSHAVVIPNLVRVFVDVGEPCDLSNETLPFCRTGEAVCLVAVGEQGICCPGSDCSKCGRDTGNELVCGDTNVTVQFNTHGRPSALYSGISVWLSGYDEPVLTNSEGAALFEADGIADFAGTITIDVEQLGAVDGNGNTITEPFMLPYEFVNGEQLMINVFVENVFIPVGVLEQCDDQVLFCGADLHCQMQNCAGEEQQCIVSNVCCPTSCLTCGRDGAGTVACGPHTVHAMLLPVGTFTAEQVSGIEVELRVPGAVLTTARTNASGIATFAELLPDLYELHIDVDQSALADARSASGAIFDSDIVVDATFLNGAPLTMVHKFENLLFAAPLGGACSINEQMSARRVSAAKLHFLRRVV